MTDKEIQASRDLAREFIGTVTAKWAESAILLLLEDRKGLKPWELNYEPPF
ncbi:hypothetical protein RQ479_04075 [Mesorhizobium sp. ISC25]|uniref:hypothetical protein n=1 Tax=Mesorhizobium sp. ISC25 TaxID=3077335 RepID=UPI0035E2EFD7